MRTIFTIIACMLLISVSVHEQALGQCAFPKTEDGITAELLAARAGEAGWAIYEWSVTYDHAPGPDSLYIYKAYFEVASPEASIVDLVGTLYSPEGDELYLHGQYEPTSFPDSSASAIALRYVEGDQLQDARTYLLSYSTEPLDSLRLFIVNNGFRSNRDVFDQVFTMEGCELAEPSKSTATEKLRDLPGSYELSSAYPNPFNPQTQFTLTLATQQQVTVEVFDVLGQRVATLHEGALSANQVHTFRFEAGDLPSGVYLYRARGENFTAVRQVMLVK